MHGYLQELLHNTLFCYTKITATHVDVSNGTKICTQVQEYTSTRLKELKKHKALSSVYKVYDCTHTEVSLKVSEARNR